jgi:tetratricopeptide (TPR) repeat protein
MAKSRPVDLNKAKMKTSRLFREMTDLATASDTRNRSLSRAKSFFSTTRRERDDFLKIGRRFIEECLALNPKQEEARLYLAAYFSIGFNNYEAAQEQYRKLINMPGVTEVNRAEAMINMGSLYSIKYRYGEALACFREVYQTGAIKRYPARLYRCLILLAITHAKLGEFDQAISIFDRTVEYYPKKLDAIRDEIKGMKTFQSVVESHDGFRRDLESRVPALFAS